MLQKNKVAALAILTLLVLGLIPFGVVAQGQYQSNAAQQIVSVAEKASAKVEALIDWVESNQDAQAAIEDAGLTEHYIGNVTLFNSLGADALTTAKEALANSNNDGAIENAFDALRIFREVYRSVQSILGKAGVQPYPVNEGQGLLEAIDRELARIERLIDILPEDAPQEIKDLLNAAQELLNDAKDMLLEGKIAEARASFLEAKQSLVGIYQFLKERAQVSNEWRLNNYCQGLQERIRERFRHGRESGADVDSVLQSFGFGSENQFINAIQNRIEASISERNFEKVIQNSEQVRIMVQQMEQAINDQINHHSGQSGSDHGSSGSGGNGGNR